MFEREVKFIYDFNSSKVKKLGTTATYAELIPLDLHPAIMRYIAAEIEYRVFEDRQTLLKHSMFDYSGYEISKHFSKITDEIKKEKKFSTDFISKIILHATSFNVNYLVRPNWSLKKLIFDTNDSKSVAEINQILNYTYFYKHIPKVTREYFEKKKLITMNKEEFGNLLDRLDKASFDSYGKDLIEAAVKSIASFFNIGSMKKSVVPLQAIGVFLQEKNLTDHLAQLEEKLKGETKSKIELNDLKSILFQVPIESSETFEFPKVPSEDLEFEEENIVQSEDKLSETDKTSDTVDKLQPKKSTDQEIEKPEQTEEKPVDDDKLVTDETPEDDVEIKLRSNKEKEVLTEAEKEPDTKEISNEVEHEEDESVEYLVDEKEDKSDIILTPEDEEESETEETEVSNEGTQSDSEEKEPQDDYEELIEDPDEDDESDLEIIADEVKHFEDLPDEPEEEKIEQVEEAELDDKDNDDYLEIDENDETDTEELIVEDEMEYEVNPDTPDDYSFPEEDHEEALQDSEEFDEEEKEDDLDYLPEENEDDDVVNQTTLFGDIPDKSPLDESDEDEKENFIQDYASQNKPKKIDIADLLENKNMTKIIAVVFDYDMEEFANAVEKVCDSTTSQEAFATLNEIFEMNDVNPSSKEAQAFREIIAEYFEQN